MRKDLLDNKEQFFLISFRADYYHTISTHIHHDLYQNLRFFIIYAVSEENSQIYSPKIESHVKF